jgi:hypothetical protein
MSQKLVDPIEWRIQPYRFVDQGAVQEKPGWRAAPFAICSIAIVCTRTIQGERNAQIPGDICYVPT